MILITGASGLVGRTVLAEATKRGLPVRAMYRGGEEASKAPSGTATVVADFAETPSLNAALRGIDSVFLVCSPIPQLVELESNVIDACKANGVRHIVLNSALGAGDYPKSFPSWHRKVEEKVKASGVAHTILRPNSFMQNLVTYFAPSIRGKGEFYAAMGNAKMSVIDVRDVAEVTAKALATPAEHSGKTYELNGPEALSYAEMAEKISKVVSKKVQFVDIPESAQKKAMLDSGMPEWQVTALLELQQYYTVERKGGELTKVLADVLGRQPITLDRFLSDFRESFRGSAATA